MNADEEDPVAKVGLVVVVAIVRDFLLLLDPLLDRLGNQLQCSLKNLANPMWLNSVLILFKPFDCLRDIPVLSLASA